MKPESDRRRKGVSSSGQRRDVIMDVAESHLARRGYRGVSLEAIAGEVGVSKPALYYHFPDGKEQLFVEIAHRSLDRVLEGLEGAMERVGSGAEKLSAAARWLIEEGNRGHPVNGMHDVARFSSEEHYGALAESFRRSFHGPIHVVISSAISTGEFRDRGAESMTWAFLGLMSGMLDVHGVPREETDTDGARMAEEMVGIFLGGVLAHGEGHSEDGG